MSPFEDISSFWVQHNRDVKLVKVCWSDMHEHEISYAKKGVWLVYESPKLKDLIALHPLVSGVMRFGRTHSCGLQKITSRMRSGNPACLKVWIRHIWQESKRFVRQNSTKRLHTINTPSPTTQLTKLYCLIYIYIFTNIHHNYLKFKGICHIHLVRQWCFALAAARKRHGKSQPQVGSRLSPRA